MVTHEIWIQGSTAPVILDLDDDQLFQNFKRWITRESTAGGWFGTVEDKTWAINFASVAGISISSKRQRGSMGFGS